MRRFGFIVVFALTTSLQAFAQTPAPAKPVDFNREVRPILANSCFACHGPDDQNRKAGVRLDTPEGLAAARGKFKVVAGGSRATSRLWVRISAENAAMRMPPPSFHQKLTQPQIELIGRWIDEGAQWKQHWSYVPPKRVEPPPAPPAYAKWARNPIDRFLLARLEKEGLKPSPEAEKATLLRRVTLDLTGLPPAPAEIDSFLADKSPNAYEKRVEQLLASPRYGERMAMQWLDLARYADTHGYHIDSHRDMWAWRDWLIGAFNRNLPFDQFTIQQLAGDLLPDATRESKLATGFHRNHMINYEGGAIPEEYQNEYVMDRVETTATVWMGMTMGCARCHDHKYDPLKQRDFYSFGAFFNTIPEKGLDGRAGNAEPILPLPTDDQAARLAEVKAKIAELEKGLPEKELAKLQAAWEPDRLQTLPLGAREGLLAHYELDGNFFDSTGRYQHGRALTGEAAFPQSAVGRGTDMDGKQHIVFGSNSGDIDPSQPFSLAVWVRVNANFESAALQKIDRAQGRRGWEIYFDEYEPLPELRRGSFLEMRFIHQWPDKALVLRSNERIPHRFWYHLAVVSNGKRVELHLDGKPLAFTVVKDTLGGASIRNSQPMETGNKAEGLAYVGGLDDIRVYDRPLSKAELTDLAVHLPVRGTILEQESRRSKEQKDRIRDYFLTREAAEPYRARYHELVEWKAKRKALDKEIPTVMVMSEMATPRETYVLGRGDYRNRTEKVTAAPPAALPPLPPGAPANRLGLARWLTDPSHPLTARVAVNRYWQMYFGQGIVKTTEDFGTQGEPPVHPELLDWLATEFVRTGWDVKAMQRLLVNSAAYRQSSKVSRELHDRDPENRLLARGPRLRLGAETIRDNALAVSGLLNGKIGGPSFFPYQPAGVWEELAYGDIYSAQRYKQSHGDDLYRRSMYIFWKRTAPHPAMITFDAPDREKCSSRRLLTNTPLQALVLMNDPTYVEAARALAARMLREGGADAGSRIRYGFRLATARRPETREAQVLRDIAEQQLGVYRRKPAEAEKLLGVGEWKADAKLDKAELAAWTMVASAILNLDETITKE